MKKLLLVIGLAITLSWLFANDTIWDNRNSAAGAEKAYTYYKTQYTQKQNYDSAWQLARAAHFYADFFIKDGELKKKVFAEGKDAALNAVELNSQDPEGHYWLGANYGSWAETNGVLESLNYADDIAAEMTKVIKINPTYKDGTPYAIRAKVYYKAPGWPLSIGDPKKAGEDFEQALKYAAGKNRKVYRFYAEYLIGKDKAKALQIAKEGLAIPHDKADKVSEDKEIETLQKLIK